MERPSTKTLDCFVEFDSPKIARDWFKKWFNTVTDVELKFKNRIATVEVSNQDELHRSLFPHAKGIKWQDGQPHKVANAGSNATFRGFLNEEELRCLWNSAERPHRVCHPSLVVGLLLIIVLVQFQSQSPSKNL